MQLEVSQFKNVIKHALPCAKLEILFPPCPYQKDGSGSVYIKKQMGEVMAFDLVLGLSRSIRVSKTKLEPQYYADILQIRRPY